MREAAVAQQRRQFLPPDRDAKISVPRREISLQPGTRFIPSRKGWGGPLGIYGGYFGGAVGIMMMAVWGLQDSRDPKSLNAPRTLLASTANVMVVLTFVSARAVHWPETLVMLVAAAVGGYGGAQIGRRAPAKAVRVGTLLLTACITLAFFVRAYAPWR
jgi:uncharacterized membrane protein YfcA